VREVLGSVDVEREARVVTDFRLDTRRAGPRDRRRGGVREAEGGRKEVRRAESERVHAAVVGGGKRDRACRLGKLVERLRRHEWAIGHDDERAVRGARMGEGLPDRIGVPRSRVDERLDRGARRFGVRRDE
jgi:hypothetical protein